MTSKLLIALCLYAATALARAEKKIPCISRSRADSLSTRLVQWNDRICPLNTLATDFTLKVCGQCRPYGYTPEQVVASWALYPETWNRAPLLLVENKDLRQRLGIRERHVAVVQLYDGDTYRLQALLDATPADDTRLIRAITDLDERVRLVAELISGTLIQPAPEDTPPLPAWRLRLELWNNRFPLFNILYAALLLAATVGFIYYLRNSRS